MAFRGLFIGIDRYQSPAIDWLGCSVNDARALHALFSDTLGDGGILLVDDQATRAAIKAAFDDLAQANEEDVVVIAFSGHGSDTHELVTHDTNPQQLAATSIALDELSEWFGRIPSRRVVCFLDCCFSGGAGAKVLRANARSRDLPSTDALLQQLSGKGRIIFTASAADEPAWESPRFGHGFMTHFLIEALRGAEEAVDDGKISLYRVLDYVTRRVADAARHIGREQQPCMRGSVDGEVTWPIFHPGPQFLQLFPALAQAEATEDIQSLAAFGFPASILDAWAGSIPSLNTLQLAAISEFGLLRGEHIVVSAPTSSGKTMIGELAALRGAVNRRRAVFLLPLKALVADKQRQFSALYGPLGVRTIEATGDSDDISDLLRGRYDIALLTYEKFAAIVLAAPHVLEHVGTVVIDEVQMIADRSRGATLEFLLTLLRTKRRHGVEPQVIALSAVIGDTNGLERWFGARLLRREERPVPLDEGLLRQDGSFRYLDGTTGEEQTKPLIRRMFGKGSSQDWVIPLVQRLVGEGKQVIIFRETKGETRGCAQYLAKSLGLPAAENVLHALPESDGTVAAIALRETLRGGVAFHNADLDRDARRVIEEGFRAVDARLRVIVATTTLAMGVNTPAGAVVVVGLEHPAGNSTTTPYTVAEYKNLVGRAGRLGVTERGESYLLATNSLEEHRFWRGYVLGHPEDLVSRFLDSGTDSRSVILRVLAATPGPHAGGGMTSEGIAEFLEASFGAFQRARMNENWRWDRESILRAVEELRQHSLIETDAQGHLTLRELGRLAGETGITVESIIRLVECLRPLSPADVTDPLLIAAAQCTVELDDVLMPMNWKSTQKEPTFWLNELLRQGIARSVLNAFHRWSVDGHTATARAKRAASCLLYITVKPLGEIERVLTQFGRGFDGAAGPVRAVASRTCDVLGPVGRIAEILHPALELSERVDRLRIRLEVGIPSESVPFARHAPLRLGRGDYLALLGAGHVMSAAIQDTEDAELLKCIGQDTAKLALLREAIRREQVRIDSAVPVMGLPEYVP